MNTIAENTTVTTSFSCDAQFLELVRELAQRRGQSVTKLIVDALNAELVADEVAGGERVNGRVATGSWSQPLIAERPWNAWDAPLPMHERGTRIVEVRRMFSPIRTVVPSTRAVLFGLPAEVLPVAQRAFDAQLVRSLAEREARVATLYEKEDRNVEP